MINGRLFVSNRPVFNNGCLSAGEKSTVHQSMDADERTISRGPLQRESAQQRWHENKLASLYDRDVASRIVKRFSA